MSKRTESWPRRLRPPEDLVDSAGAPIPLHAVYLCCPVCGPQEDLMALPGLRAICAKHKTELVQMREEPCRRSR